GREAPGCTCTDHEFDRREPVDQVLGLNGALRLSVATRCHEGAPVGDIGGFDLEIVRVLDMQGCLERLHHKRPFSGQWAKDEKPGFEGSSHSVYSARIFLD